MKRVFILIAISLSLCSTASAFQGGGGESTKKKSLKKAVTKNKPSGTTAREQIVIPSWLRQLKDNPIIPGIGLAGIQLGFSERRVADQLGAPTERGPVKSNDGQILFYRLNYMYKGVMLGFYTNPGTRTVRSMRVLDEEFNKYGFIGISTQGLTVGISETRLREILGQPYKTDKHSSSSCTGRGSGNGSASTYYYDGISFWVCDESGMVPLIDIPEWGRLGAPATRAPATAELTIRTIPANTLILIDGEAVGVTGEDGVLNLPTFKLGEHIIVARRERYREVQRTIMLEANRSQVAQLELSALTGTLNINVNPGDAQIEIEGHGSYADKVSNLELDAGSYSITASKPGYQTLRKTVEIESGLPANVTIALEPVVSANPQLAFVGRENFFSGGQNFTRYKLTVTNSASYAQDMFASAPDLPPCGLNHKSSRTWVDVYDHRGVRLYGFCAFSKPSDLNLIWFALPAQLSSPSVYVVLNDRLKNKEYKSNLVAIP